MFLQTPNLKLILNLCTCVCLDKLCDLQSVSVGCHFWATVCKTVRPILSDCCPVCLLVYCGQMVGRIKVKLGMQVRLD